MKYSLNLAHLYGDLLNTYGDIGNILALRYYAKQMDTDLKVDIISLNQEFNPEKYDIAFFWWWPRLRADDCFKRYSIKKRSID